MTRTAGELLETAVGRLAPDPHANRLLPLIARGAARPATLAALAVEQRDVIASDRRAFQHLAERSRDRPACADFFTALAAAEAVAQDRLGAYAAACREAEPAGYEPMLEVVRDSLGEAAYAAAHARLAGRPPPELIAAVTSGGDGS